MKLSHSKLNLILNCPMSYYLSYVQGISQKAEKPALMIGSAVHWGIEHDTEDLTDFYKENGTFKQGDNYTREQLLAEAMVHGYLKHKDEIYEKILTDPDTGEKLTLEAEEHELYVTGKLKTKRLTDIDFHDFVGIIDLLLLTNKGWIIIDYKTSTMTPDWDNYLDQIYRYIMLLRTAFPEVPVCKVGIINIRKTGIRQKKSETEFQYLQRMKFEYDVNDEEYVVYHEYPMSTIDPKRLDDYIDNMSNMCDLAHMIDKNKLWYINYGDAVNVYGKTQFYDIFYHTPDNYALYKISDYLYDEDENTFIKSRDCVPLDMDVLEHDNCLNKYSIFKEEFLKVSSLTDNNNMTVQMFIDNHLRPKYRVDEYLLDKYSRTLLEEYAQSNDNKLLITNFLKSN